MIRLVSCLILSCLFTLPADSQDTALPTVDGEAATKRFHEKMLQLARGQFIPQGFSRRLDGHLLPNVGPIVRKLEPVMPVAPGKFFRLPGPAGYRDWVRGEHRMTETLENQKFSTLVSVKIAISPSLEGSEDLLAKSAFVPAILKPGSLEGGQIGDLCYHYSEGGTLMLVFLRGNAVVVIHWIGPMRVPPLDEAPGTHYGGPSPIDHHMKQRAEELGRRIDSIIVDLMHSPPEKLQ